jgi:LacI family transcriptional regulator
MPRSGARRATQADVARRAGVSQAMVSYVLNGKESFGLSDETRARILVAMEQLNYIPNRSARNLRTERTFNLAVVIPDITNPYHPAFVRGIQDVALHQGYEVIIYNTDNQREQERKAIQSAINNHVDGLIGVFFHVDIADCQQLVDAGTALVLNVPSLQVAAHLTAALPQVGVLVLDNMAAAQAAVGYLAGLGHRRIGFVQGIADSPPSLIRLEGYYSVLAQHGIERDEQLLVAGDFTFDSGRRAMEQLLALPQRPTAVFAANDLMAVGAMRAALDAGLSIPDDLAVVGFDDIQVATMVRPSLTTIRTFQDRIGARSAELLIQLIEQGSAAQSVCETAPYKLVIRESSQPS